MSAYKPVTGHKPRLMDGGDDTGVVTEALELHVDELAVVAVPIDMVLGRSSHCFFCLLLDEEELLDLEGEGSQGQQSIGVVEVTLVDDNPTSLFLLFLTLRDVYFIAFMVEDFFIIKQNEDLV